MKIKIKLKKKQRRNDSNRVSVQYYFLFTICCLLISYFSEAQPSPDFRDPIDLPLQLADNFGDVRTNHFHTGFDIRTNGKIGQPVHAAADGYISRIKVSAVGFGKVLYITHPNGYMTVYGHLDHFNNTIGNYVREQQYSKQSFEIELIPEKGKFPVKKGDVIAYSGNSGSSEGPHLHFEIRDASGETYPLNPSRHGFPLLDTRRPVFNKLYLYSLMNSASGENPAAYALKDDSENCSLSSDSITTDYHILGVAVDAVDFINGNTNDYGVYSFEEEFDGANIFGMKFDRLDFSNGRYVNAHIDYALQEEKNITIHRLYRLPGDHNDVYDHVVNNGRIEFQDTFFHQVIITATDANNNISRLSFHVRYSGKNFSLNTSDTTTIAAVFKFDQPNSFTSDSIRLHLPPNILYDDLDFHYSATASSSENVYSDIYHVHDAYTPVHDYYQISILPKKIPEALKSKALIIYQDENGSRSAKTTSWNENFLTARAREFGDFYVMLDTVAPRIATVGVRQNQLLKAAAIRFYVSDNLSGIASYNGYLDGKWILMEYDPKNKRLTCSLNTNLAHGEHTLKVIVTDAVKNENSFVLKFKK